jgi:hypothetical protein
LDLHFGHLKIPTRNSGLCPFVVCFAGDTVQHLIAVATSVPQFGQSTMNNPRIWVHSINKHHLG